VHLTGWEQARLVPILSALPAVTMRGQ